MIWQTRSASLDLAARAGIMGILNVTPDSFSDGGAFEDPQAAVNRALEMENEGSVVIDIGGESTRPGAEPVPAELELARVLPVISGLRKQSAVLISIDTTKASVARAALDAGADIINDISALRHDPEMLSLVASSDCGLVLMHMQGSPRTMQQAPAYQDVSSEVRSFLLERAHFCADAGISQERLVFDPGIGFGKSVEHNLQLLRDAMDLAPMGRPVLLGFSRKSFMGKLLDLAAPADRLWPTVALTAEMRRRGVRLFRAHDVLPNVQALRMIEAIQGAAQPAVQPARASQ